jgi:hypothetical protein
MAAQRPLIMAALKQALVTGVTLVAGRVYLPWEAMPDPREEGQLLQIDLGESEVDDSEVIGKWMHRVQVRLGCVRAGVFDYPAVWEVLNQVASTLLVSPPLGGTVWRVELTGCADSIEVAGDKIMWPHLAITLFYLTPAGAL